MTSQLVLVIVVVAAGVGIAAALALRTAKVAHRRNEAKDDAPQTIGEPTGESELSHARPAADPSDVTHTGRIAHAGNVAEPGGVSHGDVLSKTGETSPAPEGSVARGASGNEPEGERLNPVASRTAAPAPTAASRTALAAPVVVPLEPAEVFAKLSDLALGKSRPASSIASGHAEIAAATSAALMDAATQQRYAPRRPNMLPRILNASSDDGFSSRELSALIAHDPSLVGNVLKIANSSFYRISTEPVESVDRAVTLLGTDGIRSVVTAALIQPIFRIGGADFPRFPEVAWEHTFRSASAAVPYNFLVEKSDPSAAELLSLVMGLAGIVIFRVTMDQYAKNPRLRPESGVVSSVLDRHSAEVARRIGASWELSDATLAGLDGQNVSTTKYPTALGRSLYFGRLVGALAVLHINHVLENDTAKASIPATTMPEAQLERMWARLTPKPDKQKR